MMRPLAGLVVLAALSGGCAGNTDSTVATEVRAALDKYVQAVEAADDNLLREVWVQPEDVSYVNPLQRLRSWGEVQGFWQGFLKNSFSQRELTLSNVAIEAVGDVAWVVFDWEFAGIQTDGKPSRSRGWETQVYQRTERGWRMRHAHYSVPAPPPPSSAQAAP